MFEQNPHDRLPQLDAMRMGVEYRLEIKVREFKMSVRPITITETIQVASKVADKLMTLPKTAQNRITEHVLLAKETLMLASTSDVDVNDPKITDFILDRMTPDEIDNLFKQYVAATDKVNPSLEEMSTERVEALVEDIKKNPSLLIEHSFLELVNVSRYLLAHKGE